MSKDFQNLVTRFAYVTMGFVLGIFAYDQFANNTVATFEYALRQHALAVQTANIAVTSFSTQSTSAQETEELDLLIAEYAQLEEEQIELAEIIEGIVVSRVNLENLLADESLDQPTRDMLNTSIAELISEQNQYQESIDEKSLRMEVIESEMESMYASLEEYIEEAFAGLEV